MNKSNMYVGGGGGGLLGKCNQFLVNSTVILQDSYALKTRTVYKVIVSSFGTVLEKRPTLVLQGSVFLYLYGNSGTTTQVHFRRTNLGLNL
ncbi:hypothetical protein ACJX0J_032048, partial [Zea mays]